MRRFALMSVCVVTLAACSGGGTASSTPPQSNGVAAQHPTLPDGSERRPDVATCSGAGISSFVGGGYQDVAAGNYGLVVAGSQNEECDSVSSIVGGSNNTIASGSGTATSSFIGGGFENAVTASAASIVGGQGNTAGGEYAAIGGGFTGAASGEYATVAGGNTNTASGVAANVAGGANNLASGGHATVLGGSHNTASGSFSLAAGLHSNAATPGSFVWTDESDTVNGLTATVANQFLARAAGGVTLWTNAAATVGATLAPGSGAWASTSDRNMKTHVVALDDAEVLDRVGHLPISTWSYVTEHGVRHVGPMAQDFYAAFNVGADDRHITAIDEDGVALAAIKALRDQNASLRAQQRLLQRETRAKESLMEREIAHLDMLVQKLTR